MRYIFRYFAICLLVVCLCVIADLSAMFSSSAEAKSELVSTVVNMNDDVSDHEEDIVTAESADHEDDAASAQSADSPAASGSAKSADPPAASGGAASGAEAHPPAASESANSDAGQFLFSINDIQPPLEPPSTALVVYQDVYPVVGSNEDEREARTQELVKQRLLMPSGYEAEGNKVVRTYLPNPEKARGAYIFGSYASNKEWFVTKTGSGTQLGKRINIAKSAEDY